MSPTRSRCIVALVGATSSGKTELALELAERLGLEIVGADSRQVYRGLDIGTAKPRLEQRRRVAHHLVDHVEPAEDYHAWRYQTEFRELLPRLEARGAVPLMVGGTGLYLRAAIEGLSPAAPRDEKIRAELQAVLDQKGPEELHSRLRELDPLAAERIHPRNRVRIVRALELCLSAGIPATEQLARHPAERLSGRVVYLGLDWPREQLHARIVRRTEEMLRGGWIAEVQSLLAAGVPPEARAMQSLGYREAVAHLQGKLNIEELAARVTQQTRQYARRQLTWFRAMPVRWLDATDPGIVERAIDLIRPEIEHET